MACGIGKEAKAREGAPWLNTIIEAVAGCRNMALSGSGNRPRSPVALYGGSLLSVWRSRDKLMQYEWQTPWGLFSPCWLGSYVTQGL